MGSPKALPRLALACGALLAVAFGWLAFETHRERALLLDRSRDEIGRLATNLGELTASGFARVQVALEVMSALFSDYLEKDEASRASLLVTIRHGLEQAAIIDDLYLVDQSGRILFDSDVPSRLQQFLRQMPRESLGFEKIGPSSLGMSRVIVDPQGGSHILLVREVVLDATGQSIGTIVARISLDAIQSMYDHLAARSSLHIRLYRSDALLLVVAPPQPGLINHAATGELLSRLKSLDLSQAVTHVGSWQGLPAAITGYAAAPGFPFTVVVAAAEAIVLAPWRKNLIWTTAVLVVSAFGLLLLLWIVSRLFKEQEEASRKQREADLRIVDAMNATPAMLYVASSEGLTTYANPRWLEKLGQPHLRSLQAQWDASIHPDDFAGVKERWRKSVEQQIDHASEYRVRVADGSYRWHLSSAAPARDDKGGIRAWYGTLTDVEDLKQAEQRARSAEAQLRLLFDASPYPLFVTDRDTMRILAVSDEAVKASGWSRDELLQMTSEALYVPEDLPEVIAPRKEFTELGAHEVVRRRLRRKDRTIFDCDIAVRIVDYGGKPAYLAIAMDVTERLQAERARLAAIEELGRSQERYRLLFEANPHPIVLRDMESRRLLAVNDAAVKHYGWSREELLGMTVDDLYPPEDLPAVERHRRRITSDAVLVVSGLRHRRKDGTLLDVEMSSRMVELNHRPALMTIIQDVSARKQADARRRAAQERLRAVMDSTVDGLITIDQTGVIVSVNKAAQSLFGYKEEEVLGQNVRMLMPEPYRSAHSDYLQSYLTTGEAKIGGIGREVVGERKDGTTFPMDLAVGEIPEVGGRRQFVGTVQDITAKKAAEEQLLQSQKMEAVGQLTGGIAHDFNNILTVILANADALQEEEGLDAGVVERLDRIARAVGRASELTRNLLTYSRRQVLSPRPTNVNDLVTTIGQLLSRALGEYIEVDFVLADNLWLTSIDRAQLETALVNLCVNARDAMPDGGRLLVETGNETLERDGSASGAKLLAGEYVVIAVTDTGSGMSPEIQARMFEPFFTTKEVGKGTGLGLSMVFGFATQSGGGIRVVSEVGRGTTFRLYLPRSAQDEEAPAVQDVAAMRRGQERILLVEDEPQVRASVAATLRSLGYVVTEAQDGAAGLQAFEAATQPFDLLLTDVVMPGPLNGKALAGLVAARWPMTRIMFMSGYSRDILAHDSRLDRSVTLLAKPFRKADLAKTIREALDREE